MHLTLFVQILQRGVRAESPETPGKETHQTEKTASQALFTLCSGRRHRTWNCDKHTSPLSPLTLVKKTWWMNTSIINKIGRPEEGVLTSCDYSGVGQEEETPLVLKWSEVKVDSSCPTLYDPLDFTVHGILQARILEWGAFPFSRGSSQPRSPTLQADSLPAEPQGSPGKDPNNAEPQTTPQPPDCLVLCRKVFSFPWIPILSLRFLKC